jgi:hypothetical protein
MMKRPSKKPSSFFSAFPEETSREPPVATTPSEKNFSEYFDSDLHDADTIMLTEIYGGDFQKVWKRTHKKWWL